MHGCPCSHRCVHTRAESLLPVLTHWRLGPGAYTAATVTDLALLPRGTVAKGKQL